MNRSTKFCKIFKKIGIGFIDGIRFFDLHRTICPQSCNCYSHCYAMIMPGMNDRCIEFFSSLNSHYVFIDQNINTQFSKFFLKGNCPVTFLMCKPAHALNKTRTLTNRSKGNQRWKKIRTICGIKMKRF